MDGSFMRTIHSSKKSLEINGMGIKMNSEVKAVPEKLMFASYLHGIRDIRLEQG